MTPSRVPWVYRDRAEAGAVLAAPAGYGDRDDVLLLALPRGVAFLLERVAGAGPLS